jgi:hydroxymethylglutaryl-CoA lyase
MVSGDSINEKVRLVECPRDAMQGWSHFIPTEKKIVFLNELLKVGFDTLDFGSFVSHKAIPQMADTKEVLRSLELHEKKSRLLAIVANIRGAEEASAFQQIDDIGFPFSVSETFQKRNTNASIIQSLDTVASIQQICKTQHKRPVIYISMAFGNPYGDPWSASAVLRYVHSIAGLGIGVVSLADTVGLATAEQVEFLTASVIKEFPHIETGVHLHSRVEHSLEKTDAAFRAGCRRFDGAIHGIGGCPMAGDELVGNMDSLLMIEYFRKKGFLADYNNNALINCSKISSEIFSKF